MKDIDRIVQLLRKEISGQTHLGSIRRDPFKILIATILSARTKDENTDKAVKQLFEKYSTPDAIANAQISELEKLVKPAGFYKIKARRIREVSERILKDFGEKTPDNIDDLLSLPGVGRKTANCVLVYAYRQPAIPVDVHVHRISNRIGLVETKTPEKTETALSKIIPKKYWIEINELMVRHGQGKCRPRNPKCGLCSLNKICDFGKKRQQSINT